MAAARGALADARCAWRHRLAVIGRQAIPLPPVVVRLGAVEVAAGALSDHPPIHAQRLALGRHAEIGVRIVHALTETEVSLDTTPCILDCLLTNEMHAKHYLNNYT